MFRSYRVIIHGNVGQSFVMASSAREAGEIAAKAMHDGEQVTIEDAGGQTVTTEDLAAIVRSATPADDT